VGADFMEKEVIVDGKVINLEVSQLLCRYGIRQANKNLEV
jgi:ERCC4-type nuclease